MFTTIWLETKDGAFVHKADIPKFLPGQEPAVVFWGVRCFVQQQVKEVYREVSFYPLIDRPPVETECPLCLSSGWLNDERCPECNGSQSLLERGEV